MYVPLPDADGRASILKALCRKKPVDASVDFHVIAQKKACENLSGADLAALVCLHIITYIFLKQFMLNLISFMNI